MLANHTSISTVSRKFHDSSLCNQENICHGDRPRNRDRGEQKKLQQSANHQPPLPHPHERMTWYLQGVKQFITNDKSIRSSESLESASIFFVATNNLAYCLTHCLVYIIFNTYVNYVHIFHIF